MLVTIAICGFRRRKLPSLSSASATSQSPVPRRALAPAASSWPPITKVGSMPALGQHAGGQRGRGGLAVRAGDGDAALEAHQLGQHLRARHDRDALRARFHQFRVVRLDRAGHHDAVGAEHVGRGVAALHVDAERGQATRDRVVGLVGTGHLVAQRAQHFGDAAHADAADADEVHAREAPWRRSPVCCRRRRTAALMRFLVGLPRATIVGDALGARRASAARARGLAPSRSSSARSPRISSVAAGAARRSAELVALRHQLRGAAVDRYFGVLGLVVVDRLRERHQHAADAGGAQFGERQRAGAARSPGRPRHRRRPCRR